MLTPKEISNLVDLTSLNAFDSTESIDSFLKQTHEYNRNGFKVAAVCFYPNFARQAVQALIGSGIKTAVVAGSFPSSQSFLSTRLNECEMALEAGAEEIDIVLNLGAFDQGDYDHVIDEVRAFKGLMPQNDLKVILETGYLATEKRIAKASELALKGGADFIKTSTGKEFPGANINTVKIMAQRIKKHESNTGRKTGIKISGGVRTKEQALEYIKAVKEILGDAYINPDNFRIGASSLLKNLTKV
jgi:deoxyribose-phosphate aldolase